MKFTDDYFKTAEKVVFEVLTAWRPRLMEAHGKASYTLKSDASVVSEYDKALELELKAVLTKFDSGVGLVGEEDGRSGNSSTYWLIDPIDGTESFLRGMPGCRNMLTFVDGGRPEFALVYRFPSDDLFIARHGQGAFKNGQRLAVSQRTLDRSWVEISMNLLDQHAFEMFKKFRPQIAGLSIARDFLLVAEGILDGYILYGTGGGEWDFAPRALLIQEAGGRVANVGSPAYDLKITNMVASNAIIFDELQKCLSPTA